MSDIDKKRIEVYFDKGYSSEEELYLGNAFVEESNIEDIKAVFNEQWEEILTDDSETRRLDHILYKINFLINSTEMGNTKPVIVRLIAWYARIAAILLIPLLVYTGTVIYQNRKAAGVEGWGEISAPLGARIKFNLPDGSFGWLNSGSTIKYSLNFNKAREVQLSGEAFFDVKHNDDQLFVVKTKQLAVEVKGTAFDIAAYAEEEQIDVTLERGSVILKNERFVVPVEMKPDEQVSYNLTKQTLTKANVNAEYFSAWKEGKLILRNASLEDLARQMGRWYNADISIQNPNHIDFRYRATFEDENLREVLRLLKISSSLDFKIDERVKQADGSFSKQKVVLIVKKSN